MPTTIAAAAMAESTLGCFKPGLKIQTRSELSAAWLLVRLWATGAVLRMPMEFEPDSDTAVLRDAPIENTIEFGRDAVGLSSTTAMPNTAATASKLA